MKTIIKNILVFLILIGFVILGASVLGIGMLFVLEGAISEILGEIIAELVCFGLIDTVTAGLILANVE